MTQWQPQYQPRPAVRQSRAPARGLPPYPVRMVHFPVQLVPRPGRRRGRGHSFGYYVYLGSHPVAVTMALFATVIAWCLLAEWIMLVAMAWLLWCWLVTMGWLATLPFAALARR